MQNGSGQNSTGIDAGPSALAPMAAFVMLAGVLLVAIGGLTGQSQPGLGITLMLLGLGAVGLACRMFWNCGRSRERKEVTTLAAVQARSTDSKAADRVG